MERINNGKVSFHTDNHQDQNGRRVTQAVSEVVHFTQQPAKLPTEIHHHRFKLISKKTTIELFMLPSINYKRIFPAE